MNLVVFGASGGIGRQVVAQALGQGHRVTAFLRNPSNFPINHANLILQQGDVFNPEQVQKAVRGQQVVLVALGSRTPNKPDLVASTGITYMLQAMQQEGVSRIIAVSSIGVGKPGEYAFWLRMLLIRFFYQTFAPHQLEDINRMEQLLQQSPLDWVIVRPTTLTNGKRTGQYHLSQDSRKGIRFLISRADVADFMIKLAEDGSFSRQIIHIGYNLFQ